MALAPSMWDLAEALPIDTHPTPVHLLLSSRPGEPLGRSYAVRSARCTFGYVHCLHLGSVRHSDPGHAIHAAPFPQSSWGPALAGCAAMPSGQS